MKNIYSDRGDEYKTPFEDLCSTREIIHQITTPYSPESNGVAERKNRTCKYVMKAMLLNSSLPQNLLEETTLTANSLNKNIP